MAAAGRQPLRMGIALAASLQLAACGSLVNTGTPSHDPNLSMQSAQETMVEGQTTLAEAKTALGQATEIQFDSGYTVWVYGAKTRRSEAGQAELVILFAPSGVVKKTRLRPAYTAHSAGSP